MSRKNGNFLIHTCCNKMDKLFMPMPLLIGSKIYLLTQLGSPMAHQMQIYCSPASIVRFYC